NPQSDHQIAQVFSKRAQFVINARLDERIGDYALTEIRRFQMAEKPPSTDKSTPFTKLESSEARNSAAVAISSGRPIFPRAIRDSNICLVSLSIRWESG